MPAAYFQKVINLKIKVNLKDGIKMIFSVHDCCFLFLKHLSQRFSMLLLQIKCVCVLLGMLRQMKEIHYTQYMEMEEFAFPIDLRDFLMEILMLFLDLVCNNVFPGDWMEMIMLENRWGAQEIFHIRKIFHILKKEYCILPHEISTSYMDSCNGFL